MLVAHRFTVVPTQDCRNRLEEALANQRPISRGEPHHGAVATIQSALADLNRGYLLPAEIDGFFGPRTAAAVEAFQRDYGLAADGIVGRQTMTQLDALYNGDVIRQPVGRSVHIGVNHLNADHYGAEFPLASCVNDARKMRDIATSLGYDAIVLEDENATVANFTGFMRGAIGDLFAGDSLMITFSGHGSQLPNTSGDAEADMLDETLCFYDRMLIDDELYALFAQLREGVNVVAVFDSCHSATVAKDILTNSLPLEFESVQKIYQRKTLGELKTLSTVTVVTAVGVALDEPVSGQAISTKDLAKALDGERPKLSEPPRPTKNLDSEIAELFADLRAHSRTGQGKSIDKASVYPIYDRNKNLYDAIRNLVGPQDNQVLECSVITFSACQDPQTTPAGQVLSLFTYNISSVWGSSGFDGSCRQFQSRLLSISPPDSTPALNTYGTNRAAARLYDRPFAF